MVKIRLKRMGAKKAPFYRIVVADSRTARIGKTIQEIGHYDPTKNPADIKINVEAAQKWLSNGAQPTDTVHAMFKKAGVYDGKANAVPEITADAASEDTASVAPEAAEE